MKPTVLNDRYRLVELVGAGGMATVYSGQDLMLERPVAVKFLREPYASDTESRGRFLLEGRAAAKLDHPNIVRIYDVGEDVGNHPYLVMELVEGEDLKAVIRRDGPLDVSRALTLAREICSGVGQAHTAGIVHCDLKPQNILVTASGHVKVTDFGIARALHQDEVSDAVADEPVDVVWGSPHYLSPEQAMGQPPTPASDVYSIGVMLYEMLTGVPPFHDPDPAVLAAKHCREEPPPLTSLNPRIPTGLDWLVRKILSKDPSRRYRNADQLGVALDSYLSIGQGSTGPQTPVVEETPVIPTRLVEQTVQASIRHATPPPPVRPQPAVRSVAGTQPVAKSGVGPDTNLWMLIAVAAIAVLGLIPLWLFVYRAYTAPVERPTPAPETATVVPTPDPAKLVTVPNLRGLSAADGERLAQSVGLEMDVIGEEETTDVRPGAVVEQSPGVGVRVPEGDTISVVLAAGRPLVMPEVVGYDLDTVQPGLEQDGLILSLIEVRSRESKGYILEQTPSPETEVRAGDAITLTVSGGADVAIPLGVNLNGQVLLEQAWVSQFTYRPGGTVPVTLRWRCLESLDASYQVFIHVLTQDLGTLIAQRDIVPVNGLRPTTSWAAGEVISDPHQVTLSESIPAGTYQVRVGLYKADGRLPVADAGEAQVLDDTILVTTITVQP